MSQTFPPSWQACLTCDYWGGPRKPSAFRDQAEVEDTSVSGECVGGGWDRTQMGALQNCPQWKKWGVLQ